LLSYFCSGPHCFGFGFVGFGCLRLGYFDLQHVTGYILNANLEKSKNFPALRISQKYSFCVIFCLK
jgi:hypothetical protein